jgi:hypothetical protein
MRNIADVTNRKPRDASATPSGSDMYVLKNPQLNLLGSLNIYARSIDRLLEKLQK